MMASSSPSPIAVASRDAISSANPLVHEAAELLVAGRAPPGAGEARGELLLARGRDDDAVPPAARAPAEQGGGGEEGRADDDEVEEGLAEERAEARAQAHVGVAKARARYGVYQIGDV